MQSQIWRHITASDETEWAQAVGDGDKNDVLISGKVLAVVDEREDASELKHVRVSY
mgnify:CR=1 FL=1